MACFKLNIFLFLLAIAPGLSAQQFRTLEILQDSSDQALNIRLESNSFVKNNEYNSNTTKGFTGIGYSLKPTLEYWATKGTRLNAGLFLQQYSGRDRFNQILPIFTVQQKLTPQLDLVLGSIYGNLNHELDEPVYRVDEFYQNNVEYGLQLLHQGERLDADVWISWDEFILKGDDQQENWTAGVNMELTIWSKDNWTLSAPVQALLFHYGGEIDTSPDPVLSILNGRFGLSANVEMASQTSLGLSASYYDYDALNAPASGVHAQALESGNGFYFKVAYDTKNIGGEISYWFADGFIAPRGEFLLLSIPEFEDGRLQPKRKFVNARLKFKKPIKKSMALEFDVRAYYDLDNRQFSHSMGLYFFINEVFRLKKISANK